MDLPADNSIVLGPTNDDLVLDRNAFAVRDAADALSLLPGWSQDLASPVRDAMLAAWTAMANQAQARLGQHLSRVATPRFADGQWLDDWGAIYGVPRAPGEADGSYRRRLLNRPDVVSPNAIAADVASLVARVSPVAPVLLEPATDAAFACRDQAIVVGPFTFAPTPWFCFAQPSTARLWGSYPDSVNVAVGAYAVPDTEGALFWVVLPGDAASGEPQAYAQTNDVTSVGAQWPKLYWDPSFAMPPSATLTSDYSAYLTGQPGYQVGFVFDANTPLMDHVASDVGTLRGDGVVWFAFTDWAISNAK